MLKRIMCSVVLVPLAVVCIAASAVGQDGVPAYQNLRFNEDWSQFPEEGTGSVFDAIKKIELSDDIWVSLGGEVRTRGEAWSNFGFSETNDDMYLLYRTFLHADFHIGDNWRVFVEGKFSGLTDRDLPGGRRANLDADEGDIWNTFVEARYPLGDLDATFRVGRQELQLGKQRLISPLDWANTRRIFDGALVNLKEADAGWNLSMFATVPVVLERKSFNKGNNHLAFSGAYFTKSLSGDRLKGFDAYGLALNSFNDASFDTNRYTLGGRLWGKWSDNVSWEVEGAYQFGDVEGADIEAFMFSEEVTYTFNDHAKKPWVAVGVDVASGDDDPTDGDSETFNQLFPLGHAYLGFIDVVGRQNIIDLHGTAGVWAVPKKFRLRSDLHFFWLADDNDALYHAGGGVVRPGNGSDSQVGTELDLTALAKVNKHTNVLLGWSHFFPGTFIDKTGPDEDIDFFYTQVGFDF